MREKNLVRTERVDQVLVIWIDNPPINAGSQGVRQGVLDAIVQLSDDASLQAAGCSADGCRQHLCCGL
ncbi:MAG TPA: hypothetical protein VIG85_00890 [Comamonas sp.]